MKESLEIRSVSATLELGGDGNTVFGYAAKFNELSRPLGSFREIILPGAFTRSLESQEEVHCLWEHDPRYVLGCRSAGTLSLVEDATGLKIECALPDTTYAQDLRKSLARGDIKGMSFGFLTPAGGDSWEASRSDDGLRTRVLHNVDLRECTITCRPVYPQTEVALRSLQQVEEQERKIQEALAAWKRLKIEELNKLKR